MPELKGTRYLTRANRKLARFIVSELKYLDFYEMSKWYRAHIPGLSNESKALLGCNDRFYLMTGLLHRRDALHAWVFDRCRELEAKPDDHLDLWAREHFKDICDKTQVLTHNRGWTTHGELEVGDYVYDDYGLPKQVIALSPRYTTSTCYRLTFSDGAQIIAGGGHLWRIRRKHKVRVGDWRLGARQVVWDEAVVSTCDLPRHADVGVLQDAVQGEPQQLPVDPYVLGVWLGDGTTGSTQVTCGLEDVDEMERLLRLRGTIVNRRNVKNTNKALLRIGSGKTSHRGSSDFLIGLRALGICGSKAIPEIYQAASRHQRMMLLRGLMDTDGTCNDRGTATFTNVNELLARGIYELAAGLALRPRIRRYVHRTGRYAGNHFFQVSFQAHTDRCPFLLPRKAERCIAPAPHRNHRDVVSVEPVDTVPTRCIQVEGGIYLVGRELVPTHNSSLITHAGSIQEILIDPEITIAIFSHTKPIARAFLAQIKREFEENDLLKSIYPDVLWEKPRVESQQWALESGIIVKRKTNPKEATVEAHGLVDGQPTSRHYKLRIYDDIVTRESVTTPDMMQKVTIAWELSDNLASSENARKWHAGTRYHNGDTYGIIKAEGRGLKVREYPATDDGTLTGKPVLYSMEWWEKKKKTQRSTISAQMLLNPIAGSDQIFRPEWFTPFEAFPAIMNVYIMVDPSKGRKRSATVDSDRTAIAVVGIDPAGNKYLIDGYRHRMKLSERYAYIKHLHDKWSNHPGVQVVKVGYEQYGAQVDTEVIQEYQERDGHIFEVHELNFPREGLHSKKDRIERLEPDIKSGRLLFPAVIWKPEFGGSDGSCLWSVWTEELAEKAAEKGEKPGYQIGQVIFRPLRAPTRIQRGHEAMGQPWRIVKMIRRIDEDRNLYDLTWAAMEEARFFPVAPHDDLIDALARIYDMEPTRPVQHEAGATDPAYVDMQGQIYDA